MIAVITYDVPHRKTQDLVSKLLIAGYTDLHLVATPFVKRKTFRPLFRHRPSRVWDVGVEQMCAHLRLGYARLELGELKAYFCPKSSSKATRSSMPTRAICPMCVV